MTSRITFANPARRAVLVLLGSAMLAACGGGGTDEPAGPTISQFSADRSSYFVGERARLSVAFAGGAGRIEPGIGPVASGATIETPALGAPASYRLIVESAQGAVSRSLELPVAFRNRYSTQATTFRSARHEAVAVADGSVLLLGGSRGESTLSFGIDRFNPATSSIKRIGQMQIGREYHRATLLADGRILVTGGSVSSGSPRISEVIDARSGASTRTGDAALARVDHAATLLADGRVLLTGGATVGSGASITNTAEIWDPQAGTFRLLAARMNVARMSHRATLLDDGRVLVSGGFSNDVSYALAEVFDPRTEKFTTIASPDNAIRGLHGAHHLSDGSVLIVGGERLDPATGNIMVLPTALRFDPVGNTLAAAPNLGSARSVIASAALPDDRVLIFGGAAAGDGYAASAESYASRIGATPLPALPQERAWHSVTRLADGRVLIVGGESGSAGFVLDVLIYE